MADWLAVLGDGKDGKGDGGHYVVVGCCLGGRPPGAQAVAQTRSLGHFPHPNLITKRAAALHTRVFLAQVITPLSGLIHAQFSIPAGLAGQPLTFQTFQQAPDPHASLLVSELVSSTPMAPLMSSIVPAGQVLTSAGTVQFTVTFREAVSGVSAADFALFTTAGVAGARIRSVQGNDTTYTVTVETGTGDGELGLNLKDETGIAAATGIDPTMSRNGAFEGEAYTLHKTLQDVNLDFVVTPLDALMLIHAINGRGGAFVPDGSVGPGSSCYDVNVDGWIAPLDVLLVISYLNQRSLATGEGEWPNNDSIAPVLIGLDVSDAWSNNNSLAPVLRGEGWGEGSSDKGQSYCLALAETTLGIAPVSSDPQPEQRMSLSERPGDTPVAAAYEFDSLSTELEDVLAEIAAEVGRSWT